MRPLPERHPGIRIDKITPKGGAGLVFTIATMLMFLVALPQIRWFFVLVLPAGALVGLVLYLLYRR